MNETERQALARDTATLELRSMILGAILERLRNLHDILNQYFTNYRVFEKTGVCPICDSHEPASKEEVERQLISMNQSYDAVITRNADVVQTMRIGTRTLRDELGLTTVTSTW